MLEMSLLHIHVWSCLSRTVASTQTPGKLEVLERSPGQVATHNQVAAANQASR